MTISALIKRIAGIGLAISAAPALAQQPNLDLMVKWSGYEVVHYDLVGVYAGKDVSVAHGRSHSAVATKANDRIEVSFDWGQNQYAIIGTPTFKNFATTISPFEDGQCGRVSLNGAYEHLTLTAIGQAAGPTIPVSAKRNFPAAEIPYLGETECGVDTAAAKIEDVQMSLLVLPSIYFGNPNGAGANVKVSAENQTIVMTADDGWTWTYKITPVR